MRTNGLRFGAVAAGLFGVVAAAGADIVPVVSDSANSTEGLGYFTGTVDYTPGTGVLVISLTNDAQTAAGGKITGFLFNIGGVDFAASAALSISTFASFQNTGLNSAAPFGSLDAGAALGGSFLGGGSPNPGIAIGQTGVFTFQVTASDAASLSAIDFVDGTAADVDFVVRFRGFDNGGSDKVPGITPAPATAGLLGLAGLLAARRRRA